MHYGRNPEGAKSSRCGNDALRTQFTPAPHILLYHRTDGYDRDHPCFAHSTGWGFLAQSPKCRMQFQESLLPVLDRMLLVPNTPFNDSDNFCLLVINSRRYSPSQPITLPAAENKRANARSHI